MHMRKVDQVLETDDDTYYRVKVGKDGREGDVGRQANLEDRQLKLQASCLAALEIVLEDIEGHLDNGKFEHPDRLYF